GARRRGEVDARRAGSVDAEHADVTRVIERVGELDRVARSDDFARGAAGDGAVALNIEAEVRLALEARRLRRGLLDGAARLKPDQERGRSGERRAQGH